MEKRSDDLRISRAAQHLSVSPNAFRNWVNAGKVAAVRHPANAYRLIRRKDLAAFLKQVAVAIKKTSKQ